MVERTKHVRNGGMVFHIYSRLRMERFVNNPIPEINRTSLVDCYLFSIRLKPAKMRNQVFFCHLPDGGPVSTKIREAMRILRELGAIDSDDQVNSSSIPF